MQRLIPTGPVGGSYSELGSASLAYAQNGMEGENHPADLFTHQDIFNLVNDSPHDLTRARRIGLKDSPFHTITRHQR